MKNIMIKIDRLMAWILFVCIILYFISGLGMTKGIIDSTIAAAIHNGVLKYITLTAFIIHSGYAIRLAFIRWRVWNNLGKIIWSSFYALFIILFIYIDNTYQKISSTSGNSSALKQRGSTSDVSSRSVQEVEAANTTATSAQEQTKTFTLNELAKYNGENGSPAYTAVDGNVYDMSSVFKQGTHFSHYAGTELTSAFYSYHTKTALSKCPIVGELIK